jgi:uncharacterized protein YndB with AHSA1/START domain
MTIKHETLTFNRILKHAPARVFRAFTQTAELEKWSPPDESMNMRIEKGSCDPGSRLIWGCGPGEAEGIRIQSDYFHIEQDTALLYSEALYMQDTLLSVGLVTVTLSGSDTTELEIHVQVSAVAAEALDEYGQGWNMALGNLETLLES